MPDHALPVRIAVHRYVIATGELLRVQLAAESPERPGPAQSDRYFHAFDQRCHVVRLLEVVRIDQRMIERVAAA